MLGKQELVSVQASGNLLVAATRILVLLSTDSGTTWTQAALPSYLTIRGVTLTPEGQILVAAREGAYRSSDSGAYVGTYAQRSAGQKHQLHQL